MKLPAPRLHQVSRGAGPYFSLAPESQRRLDLLSSWPLAFGLLALSALLALFALCLFFPGA